MGLAAGPCLWRRRVAIPRLRDEEFAEKNEGSTKDLKIPPASVWVERWSHIGMIAVIWSASSAS